MKSTNDLNYLAIKIKDLPTLPVIINKIISLTENPKTSAADIAKVISKDPSLSAKILSIVNSAFYGFPRKIATVSHAIMILGFSDIKNIALSVSVFDIFKNTKITIKDMEKLWRHSIGVGVCAKHLGKRVKYSDTEEAFIAGLLHDIGRIALIKYATKEYIKIKELSNKKNIWMTSAEKIILSDFDHTTLGELIAEKWKLPKRLVKSIRYHHEPQKTSDSIENMDMLTCLVHAGDVFARVKKIGDTGDNNIIPKLLKEVWYKLKLNTEELNAIYESIENEMEKTEKFLELVR